MTDDYSAPLIAPQTDVVAEFDRRSGLVALRLVAAGLVFIGVGIGVRFSAWTGGLALSVTVAVLWVIAEVWLSRRRTPSS